MSSAHRVDEAEDDKPWLADAEDVDDEAGALGVGGGPVVGALAAARCLPLFGGGLADVLAGVEPAGEVTLVIGGRVQP